MTRKKDPAPPPDPIHVMTKKETAQYMRLSLAGVEKLVAMGRLNPIRYPGIRRSFFTREAVDRLIDICQMSSAYARPPKLTSEWGLLASRGKLIDPKASAEFHARVAANKGKR